MSNNMFNDVKKIVKYSRENDLNDDELTILALSYFDSNLELDGNGWLDDIDGDTLSKILDSTDKINVILADE